MREALKSYSNRTDMLPDIRVNSSSLQDLFRVLLSYIERHAAYSSPIRAYLFVIGDDDTMELYDSYNVDTRHLDQCSSIRKGDCYCGNTFSLHSPSVINYSPKNDTQCCEGICPQSHITIPIMYNSSPVGLLNVSLPNTDTDQEFTDQDYPEIFDLVSGYLGAEINNRINIERGPVIQNMPDDGFQVLLESAPDAIIVADSQGRMVTANKHCSVLLGYEQGELLGQRVEMLLPESLRKQHKSMRQSFADNPHSRLMTEKEDLYARHKNGDQIPVEIALSPIAQGSDSYVIAIIRDVTHRKVYEFELRRRAFVAEHSPNPIIEMDRKGKIVYANRHACLLSLDDSSADWIQTLSKNLLSVDDKDQPLDILTREIRIGDRVFQQKIRHDSESDTYFIYLWDITNSQELSSKMSTRSQTESTTGLSTQVAFIAALQDAVNQANLVDVVHTVLFIDLNEDVFSGSDAGLEDRSEVLQGAVRLMRGNTRVADTVARMEQGRFAVLLSCCPARKGYQVAEKIRASLSALTYPARGVNTSFYISIGVVEVAKSLNSYHDILEAACQACNQAKEDGLNSIHFHKNKGEMRR